MPGLHPFCPRCPRFSQLGSPTTLFLDSSPDMRRNEKALPVESTGSAILEQSKNQNKRSSLELDVAGLRQSRADLETEIVEVGLLAGRDGFAAGLTLGFLGAAGDVDRHLNLDLRVEGDRHGVQAEGLNRGVEDDLVAVDREAALGHHLGEVAGRDRAVEHAGLAGLAQHDEALAVQLLADDLSLLAALQVAGLELGALLVEMLLVALGGA